MKNLNSFLDFKFYEITVGRTEHSEVKICVQAKNKLEAIEMAIEKAQNIAFPRGNHANYSVEHFKTMENYNV
jgi:hypothetical protein